LDGQTATGRAGASLQPVTKEITMQEKNPPGWGVPPDATPEQPDAAPADSAYTQWYEVKKGDTLWKIAKEMYGDGSLYPEIFKANQDTLSDPDKIQVGQKLRIP
jgi:nucleoid-associated protein YgaU